MNALRASVVAVAVAVSAMTSVSTQAAGLTLDQKMSDLDQLVAMMESGYGPLQYKKNLGIDLHAVHAAYKPLVAQTTSSGDFYRLMVQFVAEFKDTHFAARIPTERRAVLGFMSDLVDGKVLIDEVVRRILPLGRFPFEKGDEILAVDGRPISLVLKDLSRSFGNGYDLTSKRYAAIVVPIRPGAMMDVPAGSATLRIRSENRGTVETVTIPWIIQGEGIDEMSRRPLLANPVPSKIDYNKFSIVDRVSTILGENAGASYQCSGDTRITIPADATMVSDSNFIAYYHPTKKGNVGYLRIAHYMPINPITGQLDEDAWFKLYEDAIQVLEQNTVGLIIDQDHNCGGSVTLVERMIGLFMGRDYTPMQFSLMANKEEYMSFKAWANAYAPMSPERTAMQKVVDLIRTNWMAGNFLTPPTSIEGKLALRPNAIRYTKPVVMTIDELSASGGDAFPAMLKGYGRVKLLGTRTSGAGGHVQEMPPLNYSRIVVSMTKSLFYRPDGVPVENNGAVPDYPYTITRNDLVNGYQDYQAFYIQKLLALVP